MPGVVAVAMVASVNAAHCFLCGLHTWLGAWVRIRGVAGLVEVVEKGFQPMETAPEETNRSILCATNPASLRIVAAKASDHAAVEHFLCTRLRKISTQEFCHQLEEPWYEPGDRLLLKQRGQIIGHVRLHWRTMFFGKARWTICRAGCFSLLPEFHSYGLAEELIQAAEQAMSEQGALLGEGDLEDFEMVSTARWISCAEHVMSEADPRDILAEFRVLKESAGNPALLPHAEGGRRQISVRHWRQVELPALMRVYQGNAKSGFGFLERNEAYWRWLVSRQAFDQILVAIEGRDCLGLDANDCQIVGYAVVHAHQILEMVVEPGHPTAAEQLLSRICADAIERDWSSVCLHASFAEPLHAVVVAARGSSQGDRTLVRKSVRVCVPHDETLVHYLGPELLHRATSGNCPLPVTIGLVIDGHPYQLSITGDGAKLVDGKVGGDYLACSQKTWLRLLLGSLDASAALAAESLTASTVTARRHAEVLLPSVPLWHSPWDDLPIG